MKRWLSLGIALFFAVTASAQARPFGPVEEADYAYAIAYWGTMPPLCGEIETTVEITILGTPGDAVIPSEFTPVCVLQISEEWAESDAPGVVCIAIIHEFGHLLGLQHSPDPDSVMNADPPLDAVPYCAEQEQAAEEAWNRRFWTRFREHCDAIAAIRPRTKRLQKSVFYCRKQINRHWSQNDKNPPPR